MNRKPTDIKHARAMKQLGVPLNTPVEQREFSAGYTKHWLAMMDAHYKFMAALNVYVDNVSQSKWGRVKYRLNVLDDTVIRAVDHVDWLSKKGSLATEQDAHEYTLMRGFIVERAIPFIDYWTEAFIAVEDGAALTIRPGDIPRWLDQDQ